MQGIKGEIMFDEFIFGKDVFLKTEYSLALDSKDHWSPAGQEHQYGGFPLSIVADFWDGNDMAKCLLEKFPDKKTLLDLGTASGSCPLSMRKSGIKALGLEGQDVKHLDIDDKYLKNADLFAWKLSPEIVETCDITYPFQILNQNNEIIKFDYIISTDCFEHLRTERLPALLENIYNHLSDDGYGIFDINTGAYFELHQTVQPKEYWINLFSEKFEICNELSVMDFCYVRADIKNNRYIYKATNNEDPWKALFWVRKK
jgi:cyclopropane fatty-acyl-phospholipid synthase-like methyltransferase